MNAQAKQHSVLLTIGILTVISLVLTGTFWAFDRGANDFLVFYTAWSLVLNGMGSEIYIRSPDHFLYAPGFAWIFSFFALLPKSLSLFIWCFLKTVCTGWMLILITRELKKYFSFQIAIALSCFSLIFVARPLLIDFQYGQVNLFILFAALWALFSHFQKVEETGFNIKTCPTNFKIALPWFFLSVLAVAKLYTLPLLLVPWVKQKNISKRKINIEIWGIFFGILFILLLPVVSEGPNGLFNLYHGWWQALLNKGFPVESHNQSIAGFLHRFLSGEPSHVLALGSTWQPYGWALLSKNTLTWIALFWTGAAFFWILYWIFRGPKKNHLRWIAILIGSLLLPSHLIWKPYFVMTFPLAVASLATVFLPVKKSWIKISFIFLCFIFLNFSGYDFVGHPVAGRLESASIFLWVNLGLLAFVIFDSNRANSSPRGLLDSTEISSQPSGDH